MYLLVKLKVDSGTHYILWRSDHQSGFGVWKDQRFLGSATYLNTFDCDCMSKAETVQIPNAVN